MQLLKSLIFLSSLLLTFNTGQIIVNRKPIKVTILYESLCPDSKVFFKYQLAGAYPYLKDYLDIEYVPFGKSDSHEGGAYFTCQHGLLECEGNRIQSCAINAVPNHQDAQTAFTSCFMNSKAPRTVQDIVNSANMCARSAGIPSNIISMCMKTNQGHSLQLKAERTTKSFYGPLRFVPTIVYDNVFNDSLQDQSLTNFAGVVCQILRIKNIDDYNLRGFCG